MERIGFYFAFLIILLSISGSRAHRTLTFHQDEYNEQPEREVENVNSKDYKTAGFKFAVCEVEPNPSKPGSADQVYGNVYFKQSELGGLIQIYVQLHGFNTSDGVVEHGFHIHLLGTIKSGCEGAKGHYNPYGSLHGSPFNDKDKRHVGDLGNILESSDGKVTTRIFDKLVSLVGSQSAMGRSIVIHQLKDDLGLGGNPESLKTGNAGTRVACCVISESDGAFWGIN